MKTYDVDEIIARHRQDIDDGQWVPAEVAKGLYDTLEDALTWVDSPHEIKRIQAALAAADGDSHEDTQA